MPRRVSTQEKAPEVDKRQSRAGSGRGQARKAEGPQEGVGHGAAEQMEGICFAELNSSAREVLENLVEVMKSYLGCPFLCLHHFCSSLESWGRCLVPAPLWPYGPWGLRSASGQLLHSSRLTAEGERGEGGRWGDGPAAARLWCQEGDLFLAGPEGEKREGGGEGKPERAKERSGGGRGEWSRGGRRRNCRGRRGGR